MSFDEEYVDPHGECAAEIERLRVIIAELMEALEPFAVADKTALVDTLGHITREHIAKARAAIAKADQGRGLKP